MAFARFMSSPFGRGIRILAGAVLIVVGLALGSAVGWVIAVVGLLPIAAGAFNVCVLGPVFGAPFSGRKALDQTGR